MYQINTSTQSVQINITLFFNYPPSSGIYPCVRTVWAVMCLHPCYAKLGQALIWGLYPKALQPDPIKGSHTLPMLGSWSSATRMISNRSFFEVRSHRIQWDSNPKTFHLSNHASVNSVLFYGKNQTSLLSPWNWSIPILVSVTFNIGTNC